MSKLSETQKRFNRVVHKYLAYYAVKISKESGATWNDGGAWHTWIYQDGEIFWRVHQPSDYSNDIEIDEVVRKETITVTFEKKEGDH